MKNFLRGAILAISIFGLVVPEPHSFAKAALLASQQKARVLTFAERVAYQYAIEEVYWHHRIWPKENPGLKPSLDEVMPRAQIEGKVEDYLRKSQSLEDHGQRPITPEQLQAEMDRMASHTKQPDVLRELFAALNNDPLVIAECLSRPILAERLVREQRGVTTGSESSPNRPFASACPAVAPYQDDVAYILREISAPLDCTNDGWTPTTLTDAPAARYLHAAVWTGSEMIIWGGTSNSPFNTGGKYNPTTDNWTATSTTGAPVARYGHTAVWTGSEMIVWGGTDLDQYFSTGGRYNPSVDSWTATNTTGAPSARNQHTAVWTGTQMIIWGGYSGLNTGGRYNPTNNTWTATNTASAPAGREHHTAVWSGSEMVIWGGDNIPLGYLNTGGRYNPNTDSWTITSTSGTPTARSFHTAVWTGDQMIIWGGFGADDFNTGGSYNPSTNSWSATATTSAPMARYAHTVVWTGSEMIIWGGNDHASGDVLNTGGRYDPITDSWTATNTNGAPNAREYFAAVWTGSEMIVWGGLGFNGALNTGGRYCAQASTPIVQSAFSRKTHGSAGSFDVDLPLTGTPGIECRIGGATNNYTMVVTFSGNVSVTGSPQAEVIVGTGCVGSGGVCNGGTVAVSGAVVTIPLTNIANAQTINVRLNGVNSASDVPATNVVIPMTRLLGDTNGNGAVTSSDVAQTKGRIGQTVTATNFRSDVNASGGINSSDVTIVKQNLP